MIRLLIDDRFISIDFWTKNFQINSHSVLKFSEGGYYSINHRFLGKKFSFHRLNFLQGMIRLPIDFRKINFPSKFSFHHLKFPRRMIRLSIDFLDEKFPNKFSFRPFEIFAKDDSIIDKKIPN